MLVARDRQRLDSAARAVHNKYRVQVDPVSADLSDRDDIARVEKLFATRRIDLLVNDAGFAAHDDLLDEDWSAQARALDLMCLAVLVLSGAAARQMVARGSGEIINISSMNSLIPADNYAAVKAWVNSYTEGLAARLAGTGVHANVTITAWVKTQFHAAAGLDRPNIPDWVWVPVRSLVKLALRDVRRGKIRSVPTLRWRLAAWALQHGPLVLPRRVSTWVRSEHDNNRIADEVPDSSPDDPDTRTEGA